MITAAQQHAQRNRGTLFVEDGELFLTGRAKDVIILRGRNHLPHEIEAAVDGVPGVRPGCSVAVSDRPEGAPAERLVLLVEARRGIPRGAFLEMGETCAGAVRGRCRGSRSARMVWTARAPKSARPPAAFRSRWPSRAHR